MLFMNFTNRIKRVARWLKVPLAGAAFLTAETAFGQMCPMCYNAAASSKAGALQALRSGTLILLIPPLVLFAGVSLFVYRKRDQFNGEELLDAEIDRDFEAFRRQAKPLQDADLSGERASDRTGVPAA